MRSGSLCILVDLDAPAFCRQKLKETVNAGDYMLRNFRASVPSWIATRHPRQLAVRRPLAKIKNHAGRVGVKIEG